MYTLDGTMLENLQQLKAYCEDNSYAGRKKVIVRDDSNFNERDDSPLGMQESLKKVVS